MPPSLLNPLIKQQKKGIRIISNSHYNAHTEPIFKSLSILWLSDLNIQTNLKFFHSFVHNLTPPTFDWVTTLEQRHLDGQINLLYDLRNNTTFIFPSPVTHSYLGFLYTIYLISGIGLIFTSRQSPIKFYSLTL